MRRASCGELEPAASVDSTDFYRESLSATLSRRQLAITLFLEETSGERGECVKSDSTGSGKLKHRAPATSRAMGKGYTYRMPAAIPRCTSRVDWARRMCNHSWSVHISVQPEAHQT